MRKRILCLLLSVCMIAGLCSVLSIRADAYPTDYPNTHVNTGDQRSDVVAIAQTQLGYAYNGGTKYGAWWQEYNNTSYNFTTEPWCAMFILWCEAQAGCTNAYQGGSALCSSWLSFFRSGTNGNAAYNFGSGYMPRPGDIVFVGYDGGTTDHVGLVTSVSDTTIYTIEGNYSKKVSAVSYSLATGFRTGGLKCILAFGVPAYSNDSAPGFGGPVTGTPETPAESETPVSYQVTITADVLNVRNGAGTSFAVRSTLRNGATVDIVAEATGSDGATWGKLSTGGWISLSFAKKV
ncbi:MAG: CHAP domain-containing protein, partial [Clostridiales bacterium]|nr:CHAP domain-containing protein [Clostridiales bacterium]